MIIKTQYKPRPVRFLELYKMEDWYIKIYSISVKNQKVDGQIIEYAKKRIPEWIEKSNNYNLDVYKIATLIIHEGKEGYFAILNWWIDENMLQHYVYFSAYDNPSDFKPYAEREIITCVWELAVIWFERNAWVEHILKQPNSPNLQGYFNAQLNEDV